MAQEKASKLDLSIYPLPESEIVVVDSPSVLEQQIGTARRRATAVLRDAQAKVHGVVSEWIGFEHAVEQRVKAIRAPDEFLTPGLLYVGVAALTGSVIARGRFTRFVLPPAFFYFSFDHFLPKTSHNLKEYLGEVETHYFPVFAQKHATARAHTAMSIERLKSGWQSGLETAEEGVGKVVRAVEETTGLKVAEALGKSRTIADKAEVEVEHLVQDLTHNAREGKTEKKPDEAMDTATEVKRQV
ncbi:apolipo protein O-domain-containing protein [Vararia minispora EC-137]|uniref:Apolipo protein O-domain-containing protein n=1 Tax=Vararia minispora EC-137 TaxID=1314806 RepID=A0ACB8QJQ0_9AGAM|nr:apolipo protein O-domain-containing protein [Vararia minispora EC-137]